MNPVRIGIAELMILLPLVVVAIDLSFQRFSVDVAVNMRFVY